MRCLTELYTLYDAFYNIFLVFFLSHHHHQQHHSPPPSISSMIDCIISSFHPLLLKRRELYDLYTGYRTKISIFKSIFATTSPHYPKYTQRKCYFVLAKFFVFLRLFLGIFCIDFPFSVSFFGRILFNQ